MVYANKKASVLSMQILMDCANIKDYHQPLHIFVKQLKYLLLIVIVETEV